MSNLPKKIVPSGGFLHELALQIKLILRLIGDKRVNPFVKIIPVVSVLYLINPVDLPTPIDDAAVLGLGMYLFIELCPQDVVAEHLKNLRNINVIESDSIPDQEVVVDADFEVEKTDEVSTEEVSTDEVSTDEVSSKDPQRPSQS